jgi:hypothetical protein
MHPLRKRNGYSIIENNEIPINENKTNNLELNGKKKSF